MHSEMSEKAKRHQYKSFKEQIINISKIPNRPIKFKEISKYNSMVIGTHNYYRITTHITNSVSKNVYYIN